MKKGDVGMAKHFSIFTETRDELATTCQPMSRYLLAPDATSLHLPQEQAAKTDMVLVVRIQVLVLCTVEEGVANACI